MLVEHLKNSQTTRLELVVYKFFSCSTNIPRGLSAYNPQKLVVYCLNMQMVMTSDEIQIQIFANVTRKTRDKGQ